jgi:hypothetical protein
MQRLDAGEQVVIPSEYAGNFMEEVVKHGLSSNAIKMKFYDGRCAMKSTKPIHALEAAQLPQGKDK